MVIDLKKNVPRQSDLFYPLRMKYLKDKIISFADTQALILITVSPSFIVLARVGKYMQPKAAWSRCLLQIIATSIFQYQVPIDENH